MAKVRGWLYVSDTSAKFVADEQTFLTEDIDWQQLAAKEKRKEFLKAFKPLKEKGLTSAYSYYIEFTLSEIKAWFRQ